MDNSYRFSPMRECLALVESRFNRGTSRQWTNYDFEKLSDEIQDVTGVMLSITTLKRVFGKVKYDHAPSTSTLNALAKYAGFDDWGEFRSQAAAERDRGESSMGKRVFQKIALPKRFYGWAGGVFLILLSLFFFVRLSGSDHMAVQDPAAYKFSSNKVLAAGLPNSVIFNYDARTAGSDSVFIAQSWDISRKKLVSKEAHAYSSIYYYPGFFRAQLIVGHRTVKHHDLLISSKGWLAAAEQPDVPIYFKKNEFLKDSVLAVTPALFEAYHLPLQPHAPKIRIYNVLYLPGFANDNFTFETTLKNDFNAGNGACQYIQVLILCKNDVIIIPLSTKGCVGNLRLFAAGLEFSSAEKDLSGFGCDPTNWITLRVESVKRHIRFIVNGKVAAALDFPDPPSGLVGLEYRFMGPSAIKTAVFYHGKDSIKLL